MARFGRKSGDDKDDASKDDKAKRQPEGVRVLPPDQVAEVEKKETTVKRRGRSPKPGDRPASPPDANKASIRLPLARTSDINDIARPKVAKATPTASPAPAPASPPPTTAPTGQQRIIDPTGPIPKLEATEVSIGQPALSDPTGPILEPPADEAIDLAADTRRRRRADAPKAAVASEADAPDASAPAAAPDPTPADDPARLSFEPPTGEVQLPHWTEPATGEVPKIIIGETPAEGTQDAWDAFAGSSPRYRDQHDNWDDASVSDLVDDDAERLGALAADTTGGQTQDDFLSFEDIEIPDLRQPAPPTRGSSRDPVRQGRAGQTTGSTPVVRTTKKVAGGERPTARQRSRERPPTERPERAARSERQPVSPPPRSRDTGENRSVHEKLGVAAPGGEPKKRNWKVAAAVGVPMAAIGLLIFNLPRWLPSLGNGVAVALIIIVVFLCGSEFMAAVTTRRFKPILPVGWAALVAMPLAAYHFGDVALPMVLFLTVFVGFGFYLLGLADEKPLGNLGVTFFTIIYIAMFGSFACLILRIGPVLVDGAYTEGAQGASILVLAIVSAVLSDFAGAVFGSLYGTRAFTPISPNKTVQGVLGGVVVSTIVTGILALQFGPFHAAGFFFAFCCAIAAPIGDLAESLLKRDLGLKDMSDLIPGHGGVLDRMDSLLFVLPVAYYVTRLLLGPGLPFS